MNERATMKRPENMMKDAGTNKKRRGGRTATTGKGQGSSISCADNVVMAIMAMMTIIVMISSTPKPAISFNLNALNDPRKAVSCGLSSFYTNVGRRSRKSRYHDTFSTTVGGGAAAGDAVGGGGSRNFHTTPSSSKTTTTMIMMNPLNTESCCTLYGNIPPMYSSNIPSKKHSSSRSTYALGASSRLYSKRSSVDKDGPIDSTVGTTAATKEEEGEFSFDGRTANTLILGQAVLVPVTMGIATILKVSNFGFGTMLPSDLQQASIIVIPSIVRGILYTAPLGVMVYLLDVIENRWNIQALKDVTKATNQSVLRVLGGKFLPLIGLGYAVGLGVAAGVGEELLFRGVVQNKLIGLVNDDTLALAVSSVIFGALHAVTPLYAGLATIAGCYFGWIYNMSGGNLLVPMVTHAVYDIAALYYSHWTVSKMDKEEQVALDSWESRAKS